jgi:hypothetical protein
MPRFIAAIAILMASATSAYSRSWFSLKVPAPSIDYASFTGLTRWYRVSDTSKINGGSVSDGDPVSSMAGKVGSEPSFTASTTARPTWSASAVNGRAALTFNGSSNFMGDGTNSPMFTFAGGASFTVCITHKITNNSANPELMFTANNNSNAIEFGYYATGVDSDVVIGSISSGAKVTGQFSPITNTWRTFCVVNNAGTVTWYLNGSVITSASQIASGVGATQNYLGTYDGVHQLLNGQIAEVAIYGSTAISGTDIVSLHTNYQLPIYGF